VDYIHLDQDRAVVKAVLNLRVSWKATYFCSLRRTVNFSRRTPLHGVSEL